MVMITTAIAIMTISNHCLLVGCLTSQQQASVSQGRICSDNCTCCHTEIEVADQTFYLTQSQYTDTGPTSPSAHPMTPGAWQGSHWSANVCHWYDSTPKKSRRKRDSNPGSSALEADALPLGQRGGLSAIRTAQHLYSFYHCGMTSNICDSYLSIVNRTSGTKVFSVWI